MLTAVMAIYSLYVLLKLYVSVMQIGYLDAARKQPAVLMNTGEYLKAAEYARSKERLSMAGTLIEYVLFIVWLGGGIAWLQNSVALYSPTVGTIAMVMGFVLINAVVNLPLEWYQKFVLDEKFGFNRSTSALFVKDTLITMVLTLLIGGVIVWMVEMIIVNLAQWWLWSFALIFGVVVLLNMFFPTVRALFFDKLTPLEDRELDAKISELMQKTGFESSGVFVSDASKRDARLNAYFGGLGRTKRVVLFDTLLQKLTQRELLAVLGHELGHFAHGDLYKNIGVVGAMLFVMFAIFGNMPESLYLSLGVAPQPGVLMVLFLLFMPLLGFVMMPLMGIVSRHNEFKADRTGAELGGSEHLVSALTKLVTENKSFPLSHPLYIFFYYTHPPVMERLRALGADMAPHHDAALGGACDPES